MKHIKILSISSLMITLSGLVILFFNITLGHWLATTMYSVNISEEAVVSFEESSKLGLALVEFPENVQFLGKSLFVTGLAIALFTLFLFVIIDNFKKDKKICK